MKHTCLQNLYLTLLNVKEFLDKNNYIPDGIAIDDKPIDAKTSS